MDKVRLIHVYCELMAKKRSEPGPCLIDLPVFSVPAALTFNDSSA